MDEGQLGEGLASGKALEAQKLEELSKAGNRASLRLKEESVALSLLHVSLYQKTTLRPTNV